MIKSKFKRILSMFMALIFSVSSLFGIASVPAFAAGEQAEVYIVEFPRSGDDNFSTGNWGFGNLNFKNGWTGVETKKTSIRAIGSYSGNAVYCFESGNSQYSGDTLTKNGEDYFDNLGSNGELSGDEIRLFIGRILYYGYCGTVSTNWRSQNAADADKIAHYYATQMLVWETVVGERDSSFNHVTPSGYDEILDCVSSTHPLRSEIMSYYNSIAASVKNHTEIPSFCSPTKNSAMTFELEADGNGYSTTLTDSNRVLSDFDFTASVSGVSFSRSGNTLTVSMSEAPSSEFTITAEKRDGNRRGVIVWSDGVVAPSTGIQDVVTYAQTVSDPVSGYAKINISLGACQIVKTSEDGKVDGIKFTVEGEGIRKEYTTQNGGKINVSDLMPGTYTVTEHNYESYEPQESQQVTVVAGRTATVNFNNTLKRGDIKVIKTSEDNFIEGVSFRLFGTSLSGMAIDKYAVTDASGIAMFNDVPISGTTPYTLEEVDTPNRYVVPENQSVAVEWNNVSTRTFNNVLKKFTVTVTKTDAENTLPQGDATLAGAKYGIYKDNQLVDEYFTDENGQFTTKEYVCGENWTICEIEPSEGYLLDPTVHRIGAEANLYTVEINALSADVTEEIIMGNIAIIKHSDNGDTQIETPEAGATFEIFLKSAGSYAGAKETERDIIVCDENGFGETKLLPYGTYTVSQTFGQEGSEMMHDFDVFIAQDGQTYRYIINNRRFESYLQVVKLDAESGKTIPYAGAGFQIYNPNGNLISMTVTYPSVSVIDTFYTDANGTLVTPEKLEHGNGYSLVEVQAPHGYVLDGTPVAFDVTEETSSKESGVTVIKVTKYNIAQKGTISIEKTGEVFFGVNVSGNEGENLIYQPVYEVKGLSCAVFEIHAAEDIYTPDGTMHYTKGELLDTLTTNENGFAKSKELHLGKYEIKEVSAPAGTVLNPDAQTVELAYAGQHISLTETASSFYNERQKASVSMVKALEVNNTFGVGKNGEIKNVTFGLFAAEEIISESGTAIPMDGLVEIITFDENGNAAVKSDLPIGSYYVKELSTDRAYTLNAEKYPVVFEYVGSDTAVVEIAVNGGAAIENELIYGSVSGMKVDEEEKPLGGAIIGIFKSDCTEFTKEKALLTATSSEDGSFSFENVPFGSWIVREIEQPYGYTLCEDTFPLIIDEAEKIVEVKITDNFIKGSITLTKVDAEYPDNKLTGATFEVYEDTNNNEKLDGEDKLLGKLTEKSKGIYEMTELSYGRYFVKETVAPAGFYLDENTYPVFIDTDDKVYSVENKAGVGFVNDPMLGDLKIAKTSSDGKLKGFAFRITGPNGYDVTLETDDKGEILIKNLRIGDYKVSEVANAASSVYARPDDKTAAVKAGATTIVNMHNVFMDSPDTGDTRNIGLWVALAAASVVGLSAATFFYREKKNENKNK